MGALSFVYTHMDTDGKKHGRKMEMEMEKVSSPSHKMMGIYSTLVLVLFHPATPPSSAWDDDEDGDKETATIDLFLPTHSSSIFIPFLSSFFLSFFPSFSLSSISLSMN